MAYNSKFTGAQIDALLDASEAMKTSKEDVANKVTSINADADDVHYPSAKAVWSAIDVQINGIPSTQDVATITSPGWTKKAFDKVIPQGSTITSMTAVQLYVYDEDLVAIGSVISQNSLPLVVEKDIYYGTCSPASKVSVTFETVATKGITDEIVEINTKVKNNADDIVELNGEAYKPEVIEYKKINEEYQVIAAPNKYDRVAKIKCKQNTRYVVSADGLFNTTSEPARVVFYDKDGELISGQDVFYRRSYLAYIPNLCGMAFETPAGTEFFIISLTNSNNTFTTVRCDEYDKINNAEKINTLSVWVLGDSISATAYQRKVVPYKSNATDNYGVGGWISEFLQKTSKRPLKWFNYARGGWFLGGDTNEETKSFSRELEIAISAYESGTIDAPDIILSVGCTNDFDYTTHQVTDSEITEGMTYDEYMEEQFVTVINNSKRILKPIEDVNTEKLAGAMRYIVQRAGTLFPNCKFVFCTPSQSTLHNPINQMRCIREMKWMANRLCVPIIDVWNEAQMPMLWDYYDEDGTERHRFLDDRVHTYNTGGSNAIGWQRQGEYIARKFSEIFKDDMGL